MRSFICKLILPTLVTSLLVSCGGEKRSSAELGPIAQMKAAPTDGVQRITGKRSSFFVHRVDGGVVVVDPAGKSSRYAASSLVFDDVAFNVSIRDQVNMMDKKDVDTIIELYIGYFNRLPDADGLSYWLGRLKSGVTVEQIGKSFYAAAILPEFSPLTHYSESMTSQDFVKVVYKNVLGRNDVDAEGLSYWTQRLQDGSETRGSLLKTILASAHSFKGDKDYGWVADLLENKLAMSYRYAVVEGITLNSAAESYSNSAAVAAAITPSNLEPAHLLVDTLIGAPKDYFVKIANAFSDEQNLFNLFDSSLASLSGGPVPIDAFDLDNDGKPELLLPMQKAIIVNAGDVATAQCKSRLVIYSLDQSDHFVDVSANLIEGSADLGGCVRKVEATDVNGDGKLDVFYAVNQEDGRTAESPSIITAQLAGLISQANGKYRIQKFGPSNWYHNVGVGKNPDGSGFVTGGGFSFGTNSKFVYQSDTMKELSGTLPWMSANTFQFISVDRKIGNDFLLMTGTYPALFSVEAYQLKTDGKWSLVNTSPAPYTVLGNEKFKHQAQDTVTSDVIVGRINDQILIDGGTGYALTESCTLRMSPNAKPSVLMKMEVPILSSYTPGKIILEADIKETKMQLIQASIVNGKVSTKNFSVANFDVPYFNFFDCYDLDGDGYDDVVLYPFAGNSNTGAQPVIYLNDKNGSFQRVSAAKIPAVSTVDSIDLMTTIMKDFNGDGIPDIVILPTNATTKYRNMTGSMQFLKGLKLIR